MWDLVLLIGFSPTSHVSFSGLPFFFFFTFLWNDGKEKQIFKGGLAKAFSSPALLLNVLSMIIITAFLPLFFREPQKLHLFPVYAASHDRKKKRKGRGKGEGKRGKKRKIEEDTEGQGGRFDGLDGKNLSRGTERKNL